MEKAITTPDIEHQWLCNNCGKIYCSPKDPAFMDPRSLTEFHIICESCLKTITNCFSDPRAINLPRYQIRDPWPKDGDN